MLARDNEQLLTALGLKPTALADAGPAPEQCSVEEENLQLRAQVAALEQQLPAAPPGVDAWTEQQKEYETLLEEKSEVIRALHRGRLAIEIHSVGAAVELLREVEGAMEKPLKGRSLKDFIAANA